MKKPDLFNDQQQELANLAKALSHPARIAILQYLASCKTCISGDISDHLPLSRTTVSQHLKELKAIGLIKGKVEGLKMRYCLDGCMLKKLGATFNSFFGSIQLQNKENC